MTTPDELKELGELAAKVDDRDWAPAASVNCGNVYVRHGNGAHTLCDTEARAAYIAYANPQRIQSLLARLEKAETQLSAGVAIMINQREAISSLETELGNLKLDRDEAKAASAVLVETLKLTQFGFMLRRCPVCAGWGAGPGGKEQGEADHVHTADCPVGLALNSLDTQTTAHLERVRALETNQRTPGTVEVCLHCRDELCDSVLEKCELGECPVRRQKEECRG